MSVDLALLDCCGWENVLRCLQDAKDIQMAAVRLIYYYLAENKYILKG